MITHRSLWVALVLLVVISAAGCANDSKPSGKRTAPTTASLDACTMLPQQETERLVPSAVIIRGSRDDERNTSFTCGWRNPKISFGEFWRDREISLLVDQWKGTKNKTGRAEAESNLDLEYMMAKNSETKAPTPVPGENTYESDVKEIPGVGDKAFAEYEWLSGKLSNRASASAVSRAGDLTISLTFRAKQTRKDNILDPGKHVTEENALREVTALITYATQAVIAWKAKNQGAIAVAHHTDDAIMASPTPSATPSPTVLAALPPQCEAVGSAAAKLVPSARVDATSAQIGNGNGLRTVCRWANENIPDGAGKKRVRHVEIAMHVFTDRAGGPDVTAAKGFYALQRGDSKAYASISHKGVKRGKLEELAGLGDAAHGYFRQNKVGVPHHSMMVVFVRTGATVVVVGFAGLRAPVEAALDGPKVTLMGEKQAHDGALAMTSAILKALGDRRSGQ